MSVIDNLENQLRVEQARVDQLTQERDEARHAVMSLIVDNPHKDGLWVMIKRWNGWAGDALDVQRKTREYFEHRCAQHWNNLSLLELELKDVGAPFSEP